eukprot:TRINITY_DN2892_c0_g1_i1.p1 TRINITY_DN2892_c0_g1~~TRINITY_DN2892_c0_g1_i1.p1  ORF type:complete len:356 (+),score=163.46 TRINITY_DN2892_c0_g1_i1:79-1068(+)
MAPRAAVALALLAPAAAVEPTPELVDALSKSSLAQIVAEVPAAPAAVLGKGSNFPSVTAHGMGDSCFNAGMKQITEVVANVTGQYATCVATGGNKISDTSNGFFMTMNKNVDVFAQKIKADPKLAKGFNCVGFSQGNSLCRGYIQKYNDPPVVTFLSVHGTVSGVAGFPNCNPSGLLAPVCGMLAKLTGDSAYGVMQNTLFQADYFRDPMRVNTTAYKTRSELAQWNNEGNTVDPSINRNFAKVKRFAMIKALKDTMIFPNEGEWWGHFADGSLKQVLTMKETAWYKNDMFGLRTADEAGKILFNTTAGNHLKFSLGELTWWVNNYFVE